MKFQVEMSSPKLKLTYFPIKALAEPIRYLLCYSGLEFDDFRVSIEKWPELKEEMPFGQIPTLEIDGKITHQSIAISRYVAKQCNLCGNNDLENLELDSLVDTISDYRSKVALYNVEKDAIKKADLKSLLTKVTLPYFLGKLESTAAQSNGFLALGRMSWADFYFVALLDYCNGVLKLDIIEDYPTLIELRGKIHSLPAIEEWLKKRPDSEY